MAQDRRAVQWTVGIALGVFAAGAGVWFARQRLAPQPSVPTPAPPSAPAVEPTPIQHPIEAAPAQPAAEPGAPLPPLADSDADALAGLVAVPGLDGLAAWLVPDHLIERIVASIDNLPQRRLAPRIVPLKPAPGAFAVASAQEHATVDAANYARYDAYASVVQAVDAKALVALYVRWYPLFQQAYRELGYPDAYFNDRLVEVIDHLLAAPQAQHGAELVRPRVFWEYADPGLESLSAGHKLLLRIGPAHAATVQAKLREIRAALVSSGPG